MQSTDFCLLFSTGKVFDSIYGLVGNVSVVAYLANSWPTGYRQPNMVAIAHYYRYFNFFLSFVQRYENYSHFINTDKLGLKQIVPLILLLARLTSNTLLVSF